MLETSPLSDDVIHRCLSKDYHITVFSLTFLPIGYDAYAAVYRVVDDSDQVYFLKIKWSRLYEASVQLPRFLKTHGLAQVAAPLPTISGREWAQVDEFVFILYPFIEGTNGMNSTWSDTQWIELGSALKQLHQMTLSSEIASQIRRETFTSLTKWTAIGPSLRSAIHDENFDPAARDLAIFWRTHETEIDSIMTKAESLGKRLQAQSLEFVLCHADIHVGNVLLTPDDHVFVVDWDQPLFAPIERDFVFLLHSNVGGFITGEREQALLFQGYGEIEINPLALAYYRYDWLVQDIVEFGEQVLLQEASAATKQDATRIFISLFEAGNSVEAAHRLDHLI